MVNEQAVQLHQQGDWVWLNDGRRVGNPASGVLVTSVRGKEAYFEQGAAREALKLLYNLPTSACSKSLFKLQTFIDRV